MTDTRSTKDLFREWRSGDAGAGQVMAQRFADWYYAIATSRLGEERGRAPCETACAKFGQGIVTVTDSRALVGWAHDIIKQELAPLGARIMDGDEANAYTGGQRPKMLLAKARGAMADDIALLEQTYTSGLGDGDPLTVLKARYRVKQWLRNNAEVPFEVAPDKPILDRAPLPLYESGRMSNEAEEGNFEQWMLSDINLCKDIAEFAHFSIALRGGLPSDEELAARQSREQKPAPTKTKQAGKEEATGGGGAGLAALVGGSMGVLVLGGVGLLILLIILGAVAVFMM